MITIKHIIVACAVDTISAYTVRYAIEFSKVLNSKLTILHIVDISRLKELIKIGLFKENERKLIEQDLEKEGRVFAERFRNIARENGVECDVIVMWGIVHKQVARVVKDTKADLLIIGGMPYVCEMGKISEGELILAEVSCPVLVVKRPVHDWTDIMS
ncbi:MAG: Universal stress protein family protein [candidate division TA06 bacterium ADurb.Bin131]|uniref:Universal stress protein family protein n=1 Tax=candidate division TA06 bacterium ADurb.Bin131 TaxID=1852827 RepID=A0A1V6CE65_UNCT6|nr:MAG: Universal stress protein family protein [candidate division TA06 bacterium ADurb.Bin131]HOC03060.1 universal stress protein [bacterium]